MKDSKAYEMCSAILRKMLEEQALKVLTGGESEDLSGDTVANVGLIPFGFGFPPRPPRMEIFEEPLRPPKIQLRESVTVTDECRREINAWLLHRFGREEPLLRDKCLVSEQYGMIIAPHGMAGILSSAV